MALYRKKPVVINAWQWMGGEFDPMDVGFLTEGKVYWISTDRLAVETLEGKTFASPGDWIIRGTHGELCPVKNEIFKTIYEAVE